MTYEYAKDQVAFVPARSRTAYRPNQRRTPEIDCASDERYSDLSRSQGTLRRNSRPSYRIDRRCQSNRMGRTQVRGCWTHTDARDFQDTESLAPISSEASAIAPRQFRHPLGCRSVAAGIEPATLCWKLCGTSLFAPPILSCYVHFQQLGASDLGSTNDSSCSSEKPHGARSGNQRSDMAAR